MLVEDASPREYPLVLHQSDLAAWSRCPAEFAYSAQGRVEDQNSASAWGTVMHHALHVLERYRDLDQALETFLYYWHPLNIDQLTDPIPKDGWLPRQGYNDLRQRGVKMLRKYADDARFDEHELLALEMPFLVPLHGLDVWLAGTVDRLAVRWHRKEETLNIDDWKSGKQKWNLRHNVQGTVYAYATLQPEFWHGARLIGRRPFRSEPIEYTTEGFSGQGAGRVDELTERFGVWDGGLAGHLPDEPKARRFTWINVKELRWVDGGYRGEKDYERMRLAVGEVARSIDASIFPLNVSGETCTFCVHRNTCGGLGLPADEYGAPWRYVR